MPIFFTFAKQIMFASFVCSFSCLLATLGKKTSARNSVTFKTQCEDKMLLVLYFLFVRNDIRLLKPILQRYFISEMVPSQRKNISNTFRPRMYLPVFCLAVGRCRHLLSSSYPHTSSLVCSSLPALHCSFDLCHYAWLCTYIF